MAKKLDPRLDLVRFTTPFGSPATMRRALAEQYLAQDDRLWLTLSQVDGGLSAAQRQHGSPRIVEVAR